MYVLVCMLLLCFMRMLVYACMYTSALFYAFACKYAGVGYAHWLEAALCLL